MITCEVSTTFRQSIDKIWPIFAQMGCVSESLGLEGYKVMREQQKDIWRKCYPPEGEREQGMLFAERPAQWVKGKYIELDRIYESMPFSHWNLKLSFEKVENAVKVTAVIALTPTSKFGSKHKCNVASNLYKERLEALFATVEKYFDGDVSHPFPRKINEYDREEIRSFLVKIEKSSYGHGLSRRLSDLILNGLESEIMNIRPLHLAARWGKKTREVEELLMYGAKIGLLDYNWHMCCPKCGHMQEPIKRLDRLSKSGECRSCNTSFVRDFSKNVEMVFHPSEKFRKRVENSTYCYVNPSRRRRTLAYIHLEPFEKKELIVPLIQGEPLQVNLEQNAEEIIMDNDASHLNIRISDAQKLIVSGNAEETTCIHNESEKPITVAVRMPYASQMRYTAMEAITSYAFRELLGEDVLERSDEVPLSNITVMFTDLKSSTEMYEQTGDLKAFHMVRDHFDMMHNIVRHHGGAIVKTIGDALMAVFLHPKDAVDAGIAIQNELFSFNKKFDASRQATIKMGIHSGPCVAVLLNNRIDFFGQMINTAARLQGESSGQDIVISLPVLADVDVAKRMRTYNVSSETVKVKGVEEPVQFVRLNFDDGFLEEELIEEDTDNILPFQLN